MGDWRRALEALEQESVGPLSRPAAGARIERLRRSLFVVLSHSQLSDRAVALQAE